LDEDYNKNMGLGCGLDSDPVECDIILSSESIIEEEPTTTFNRKKKNCQI
jgi:hypothetical protein